MEGQDLTKGNITKQMWSLAWPMMLSVFFHTLYNLVDAFWVSKLSAEAIAAVSIAQLALFAMIALSMGISVGSGVVMAMKIGAKNIKEAERVLGQSFVLAVLAGIFFTVISLIFKSEILIASGATGLVFDPALEYFTITAAGSTLFFVLMAIMFAFNSEGDTFTLTKLFALSTGINLILDPLLIFGEFGLPALGISGAAFATLFSQLVFILIALKVLTNKNRRIRFHFKNLSIKWESVKQVFMIGIPASLTQVIHPVGTAVLMFITALGFAEAGTIAFSLGFRIEFFAFLPAIGFALAAMAMIGQNIGAKNLERAKESLEKGLKFAFIGSLLVGILAVLFAGFIIGVFTDDLTITEYTNSYILLVALSYGFLATTMVEASAFQAIGKSWPGFWIIFLKFVVITIPLGYILTQMYGFDINGIWIALAAGNIISAIVGYFWIMSSIKKLSSNLEAVNPTS